MAKKRLFLSSFCTLFCVCLAKVDLNNVISYKGIAKYSHYEPWHLRGELSLIFKSSQPNGLLVYQDDGRNSFIEVFLVEIGVRFKACIGSCDNDRYQIFVANNFTDGFWHRLRITIESKNCTITVDEKVAWVPCGEAKDHAFKPSSENYLYVANFNPLKKLNNLVFPGAFHEGLYYRFQGCIGDVRFTNTKGKPVEAKLKQTTGEKGCQSACASSNRNKCQNKSPCVEEIGRVTCDCTATGYQGSLCSEPSTSLFLNGSGFLMYDVGSNQPGRSTISNTIAFRFATTSSSGVVMVTDIADDHVLIEIVDGFLRLSWDLGQGGLVLMSRRGCLDDGAWHAVIVTRIQRRIRLTVDNQKPIQAAIPGQFSFLDFKGGRQHILFGGGPLTTAFNRSLSRTNYTGFLQQFQFDEFDVIDETIAGSTFSLLGDGVLNASHLYNLISSSPRPLKNCSRKVNPDRERLCDLLDDEDMCGSLPVSSGDEPIVPDCEKVGSCPTEAVTDTTPIHHNQNLKPPVTHTEVIKITSVIRSSPSPSTNLKDNLSTISSTLSKINASSMLKTTNIFSSTSNKTILPSPIVKNRKDSKTMSTFNSAQSTMSAVATKATATISIDNTTVMAYENDVTATTGSPILLIGLLCGAFINWY